ncbi:response regulator [bacterium]|nr:response regulator [candidate division CSSED10-310 bacterium]
MALKLLLADESITVQKVFRRAFNNDNFEIAWVDEPEEIIEVVKKLHPDFVLLSDNFPGIDLQSDVKTIAELSSQPYSVILMSNRGNSLDLEKLKELGASGFVYKPLDNRVLIKTIDDLLLRNTQSVLSTSDPVSSPETSAPLPAVSTSKMPIPGYTGETIDQRARILFDIFESFFNENMVMITDSMTKALAPKIAADISSRVIEHLGITDLPKQIMTMTKGIVNDLVPQIAERVISREIESIKAEAIRLLEEEDDEDNG